MFENNMSPTRFKLSIREEIHSVIDKITSNYNNNLLFEQPKEKILIIHNSRVKTLFIKGILNVSNFENEYYKYLEYGLVIFISKNKITIYNDIYGAYQLYEYYENHRLKSIQNYQDIPNDKDFNELAIAEFIHFNHFLESNTLYNSVKRIPGGSKIEIEVNTIKIKQIFSWQNLIDKLTSKAEFEYEPYQYIGNAVDEGLNANENYLTLTGGFDSRLLLGIFLRKGIDFKAVTFGLPGNNQTTTARLLAKEYNFEHINLELDNNFDNFIGDDISFLTNSLKPAPFFIDISPFSFMCNKLPENSNLISGIMGSEIIRGPSYSSQVTLTKFAAQICLAHDKNKIRELIIKHNNKYPYIRGDYIKNNLEELVDRFGVYSFEKNSSYRNYNIYKYLFLEKYAKIFGNFIKIHRDKNINLINPYLDFRFICSFFNMSHCLEKFTPFQNDFYKNYFLYQFYAKQIAKAYPELLRSRVDRGYYLKDLIGLRGFMKLIPIQLIRKFKKISAKTPLKVVDSFCWYQPYLKELLLKPEIEKCDKVLDVPYLKKIFDKSESLSNLDKIIIQLIFGITKSIT